VTPAAIAGVTLSVTAPKSSQIPAFQKQPSHTPSNEDLAVLHSKMEAADLGGSGLSTAPKHAIWP